MTVGVVHLGVSAHRAHLGIDLGADELELARGGLAGGGGPEHDLLILGEPGDVFEPHVDLDVQSADVADPENRLRGADHLADHHVAADHQTVKGRDQWQEVAGQPFFAGQKRGQAEQADFAGRLSVGQPLKVFQAQRQSEVDQRLQRVDQPHLSLADGQLGLADLPFRDGVAGCLQPLQHLQANLVLNIGAEELGLGRPHGGGGDQGEDVTLLDRFAEARSTRQAVPAARGASWA